MYVNLFLAFPHFSNCFYDNKQEWEACRTLGGTIGYELEPNGSIMNIGAYGGAAQAGKSP